jgi:hypothetical protein
MVIVDRSPADNGGAPAPKPAAPKSASEDRSVLQAVFPTRATTVMVMAVVIGLLLIAAGFAAKLLVERTTIQANVILAIGSGILLAAFGGQANAKLGSFVLAGVVAITGFFMYWLERSEKIAFERDQSTLVSGRITGVNLKLFDVTIKNDGYAYARNDASEYDFVIPSGICATRRPTSPSV